MPLIDPDGFHLDMLPNGFKRDTKDLIGLAAVLGWKVHITSTNSVTIIAPGERKKYHFGLNGRATVNHNRIKRDIKRFADPDRLQLAQVASAANDDTGKEAAGMLAMITLDAAEEDVVDHRPDIEEARGDKAAKRAAYRAASAEEKQQQDAENARSSESEPTLLFEKPMLAKASEDTGYESKVAVERHWSDGTVDYKCVDCDYASPNRLSIRGHRTRSDHRKSERPATRFKTEVPHAVSYAPRQARVEALAAILTDLEGDPMAIAKAALTWVHEQSKQGTALAAEHEPMSAEDTLERIRALVTNSDERLSFERKMEDLNREVTELRARLEQAEEYAMEQADRADKSQSTLDALRELVTEATVSEAERKAG